MTDLTPRQLECFNAILAFIDANHYSPSKAELAITLQVTEKAITDLINVLQRKGYILYTFATARSIRILKRPESAA